MLGQLHPHRPAVVDPKVVWNQKHLVLSVLDQCLEEFDQPGMIEGVINDHPAGLALVSHTRDHRELPAHSAHRHRHRRFPPQGTPTTPHISIHHPGLIAPVNLAILRLGSLSDAWVGVLQPLFHSGALCS